MDGAVAEVHVVRLGQIALKLAVAGTALRLRPALLELRPHGRGAGAPFPRRFPDGQEGGAAARFILPHPRPTGMAMDGEQRGQRDARRGWATGQQRPRLYALALGSRRLRAQPPLEVLGAFGNHRQGFVQSPNRPLLMAICQTEIIYAAASGCSACWAWPSVGTCC